MRSTSQSPSPGATQPPSARISHWARFFAVFGHAPLNPFGHAPLNPFDNGLPEDAPRHEHMRKDLRMLLRCNAIVLCPGWERSEGCLLECSVAKQCAIRITYADLPVDEIMEQLDAMRE